MGQAVRLSTLADQELAALVEAARRGDAEKLGRLLREHQPYLLRIANEELPACLQPKIGASDLVQDTIVEALHCFARFHGQSPGELQAWLRTILLRQVAQATQHYAATRKRQVRREVPLARLGQSPQALVADQSSPSGPARREEQADLVRQALARLPDHYRQVLVWREWEDLTFPEIATRLGRSVDAVRMIWLRALERFNVEARGQQS